MRRILLTCCAAAGLLAPAARADLPQWYLDSGLPASDTDGDGIPDAWEKRTFSDPAVPDAHLDRDGDGLTDLEEFAFGSDPRAFSTMGDGWSDLEKRGAGLDAAFRVVPAAGPAQWQAWLGWSGQQWLALTATNAQGFATCYADFVSNTPPYSDGDGTVDFWLETRTDRAAWLTVSDALTTNAFPVRAGSGRVRLRAAYGGPVTLTLDPLPGALAQLPGATNGLWLCALSVLPARSNTVVFADGQTPPQAPGDPDSVDGLLLVSPPPAGAVRALSAPPPGLTLQPLRVTDGAASLPGWYCLCASEPPCAWPDYGMLGCDPAGMAAGGVAAGDPVLPKPEAREIHWERFFPAPRGTVTQTVSLASYPFIYGRVVFTFGLCEAVGGLVLGAEQRLPWHEPGYSETVGCGAEGCSCTGSDRWHVGFDHGAVNTRNLNHPEEPESDKAYLHCLGVVWSAEPFDLAALCADVGLFVEDYAIFEADGARLDSALLDLGPEPPDLKPTIFRVKMLDKSIPDIVWDRLILVVNNRRAKNSFDAWHTRFSVETNWLEELPAAYGSLAVPTTNWLGVVSRDPEPSTTNLWEGVGSLGPHKYYHHTSVWEMRSQPTANWHGHQACYDEAGVFVEEGVNAGSADFGYWNNISYNTLKFWQSSRPSHAELDVDPFIRALQLDGNPCKKTMGGFQTDHPAIYQGGYLNKYFECRPAKPNGKALLAPNTTQ